MFQLFRTYTKSGSFPKRYVRVFIPICFRLIAEIFRIERVWVWEIRRIAT